jgi:3',5'-cyclic AMP phosphodiesterase CpdA
MATHDECRPRLAICFALASMLLLLCGCSLRRPTPPAVRPPTFAVLADIQYGDKETQGARHFRTSLLRLQDGVTDLAQRDLAFVIQLGDIVDGQAKDLPKTIADQEAVLQVLARQPAPVYHVLGNHCLNLGKDRLQQRYNVERFYYDFTVARAPGWRFVVLDGNDAGYGVLGAEQLAWFTATLERAAAAHERVLCFCHFALLAEAAPNHRMATPAPVLEIMDRSACVVAWFAGHDHAGGYAVRNGVHHVTVKGLVEAPETGAYGLVELYPDHLREIGVGSEPSRDLPLPAR